jgi:hypothetical protein
LLLLRGEEYFLLSVFGLDLQKVQQVNQVLLIFEGHGLTDKICINQWCTVKASLAPVHNLLIGA